jgi:hypothetical protein
MNDMEVEEFIKSVCLTHCLQQMESLYGQGPEAPEAAGGAEKPESWQKIEPKKVEVKKIEMKGKTTSKDLLEGPLILDQQCIIDLFSIKRRFCNTSNDKIITVSLKLGLNQLSVALDMLEHKLEE